MPKKTRRANHQEKGDEAFKAYRSPAVGPGNKYSPRFLAIAERNPDGPEAIEAIRLTLLSSFNPDFTPLEPRAKAFEPLRDHYVTRPKIEPLVEVIAGIDSDDAVALVKEIIAKNPDRKIQVMAYQNRAKWVRLSIRIADRIKEGEVEREVFERTEGSGRSSSVFSQRANGGARSCNRLKRFCAIVLPDMVADLSVGATMPEASSRAKTSKVRR